MATLRSYSATFEQTGLASAAVARYRFNESTAALDSVDGLDGSFQGGAATGAAGSIGDGAASFDGISGYVLVDTLSGSVRIATLGDSLATGLVSGSGGFQAAGETFADDLPAALEARGLTVTYFDHAVPGDTTSAAALRTGAVTADTPDVVILELGANDALGQVDPATVEANLRGIIADLQGGGVQEILLAGAFGFYPQRSGGTGYVTEGERATFEGTFATIAGDTPGVVLLDAAASDKFLGGERIPGTPDTIAGGVLDSVDTSLSVGDGLHPNAAGIDAIVARVAPQTIALGGAAGAVTEPLLLANGAFEMWFTPEGLEQTLFSKNSQGQGTGGQVATFVRSDGGITFALGDQTDNFLAESAPNIVTLGTPTHLVANFGADGMHLFVNGTEVAHNATYTGGLDAGLGNFDLLVIGAESGSSTAGATDNLVTFFDGTIDEFGIYDRPLTDDEVQQLFDGGVLGTTLLGTAVADTLTGGSDAEVLRGVGGNDVIDGNGGDDELRGGGGGDQVHGGLGDDDLFGGRGADELHGGDGTDALAGKDGDDVLAGGSGDDLLEGGDGADVIYGAGGADQLFGNRGLDDLRGGVGDDLLNGGNGRDELTGGAGSDTFQIDRIDHGVDQVLDFQDGAGGDILDLSALLDFGGGDAGGFVRLAEVNGNTKVEVNADGAGEDFTAVFNLNGATGLDLATLVSDGNVQLSAPSS